MQRVMKKFYLISAAVAALTLSSCVNEQLENSGNLDLSNQDLAFVFGGKATRSEASTTDLEDNGVSISLGTESGTEFFLKETVEDLNATGLATRGTPIYDENVTSVEGYRSFEAVAYYEGDPYPKGTGIFSSMDYQKNIEGRDGWVYKKHYDGTLPWPNETDDIYFYLRMPTDYIDANLKKNTAITYNSDGSIAFDYVSPLTGETQKDILFSSRTLNKKQYETNYMETGAPVTMYHALTGVKFRVGNNNDGTTKTIITKVEISGLKDGGHCVVTPSATGTTPVVVWDKNQLTLSNPEGITYTMGFDNPKYSETSDNTITYVKPSGSSEGSTEGSSDESEKPMEFGNSWYSAAADKNLNDADGTKTFWLIPQEIPDDATLKVTFCVKTPDTDGEEGGGMYTHTIENFGAKLKKPNATKQVEWKAGQLRTYTLEPEVVDVEIFDTMAGAVKKELHVTNTGNVEEYVRMMLLGNWCDEDGNIVVGYKYQNKDDEFAEGEDYSTMVNPWFRGGYDDDGDGTYEDPYGYFDPSFLLGEPQAKDGVKSDWERGTGSYFYYTKKIGAGTTMNSATEALFQSYTLTNVPNIYIPSPNGGRVKANIHLEFEVVIQAIGTKDAQGDYYDDCWAAWTAATGTEIKSKTSSSSSTTEPETNS